MLHIVVKKGGGVYCGREGVRGRFWEVRMQLLKRGGIYPGR